MRTIIVSDVHGTPDAFEAILRHARFDSERDQLIVAGDLVDGGDSSARCIEIAEQNNAMVLFGNHDIGHMIDDPLPYRPIDRETSREFLREKALTGEWTLAVVVEGVIVVHGGFSSRYQTQFDNDAGGDLDRFVEQQNSWFLQEMQTYAVTRNLDDLSIWDADSPVWFRPSEAPVLAGVKQVVGHTSPALYCYPPGDVSELEASGVYLIDSDAVYVDAPNTQLRYGIIENGQPRVVEFRPASDEWFEEDDAPDLGEGVDAWD